jgi:hypothetical protein
LINNLEEVLINRLILSGVVAIPLCKVEFYGHAGFFDSSQPGKALSRARRALKTVQSDCHTYAVDRLEK